MLLLKTLIGKGAGGGLLQVQMFVKMAADFMLRVTSKFLSDEDVLVFIFTSVHFKNIFFNSLFRLFLSPISLLHFYTISSKPLITPDPVRCLSLFCFGFFSSEFFPLSSAAKFYGDFCWGNF